MDDSPCILIIDDRADVTTILKQYFEAVGYEVLTGGSGTEGLALAQQHDVQAILVDICMPDMNGDDVLDKCEVGTAIARPSQRGLHVQREGGGAALCIAHFGPRKLD